MRARPVLKNHGRGAADREVGLAMPLRRRLVVILLGLLIAVVLVFSILTTSAFQRAVAPDVESRTRLIGALIRAEVQRTLELGVPMAAIGGMNEYAEEMVRDFPEIRRIAIVAASGEPVAEVVRDERPGLLADSWVGNRIRIESRGHRFPVLAGSDVVGEITVESSHRFLESRLRDVFVDVAVLAVAILLIGAELTLALVAASVWKPYARVLHVLAEQRGGEFQSLIRESGLPSLRRLAVRLNDRVRHVAEFGQQSAGQNLPLRVRLSDLADMRLALFLLALATEVTASFLPLYAAGAVRPNWISLEMAAAAPLMVYLVSTAALSPLAGYLSRRFGARRLFLASIAPTALALVAMAMSDTVVGIAAARGVIAIFYALATVACQEYALRAGSRDAATPWAGAYFATLMAGAFCGTVIGGVVAGRFGYPAAITLGAAFALAAGVAAAAAMRGRAGDAGSAVIRCPHRAETGRRGLLAALLVGVALPTSATTAILVWYLTPILLAAEGWRPADTARVVMSYYLPAVLFGGAIGSLTTRAGHALLVVLTGSAFSGIALLSFGAWTGPWALVIAVAAVGLGHTFIRAPLFHLAVLWAGASTGGLNALRGLERVGAMIGLAVAAAIAGHADTWRFLFLLGAFVTAGTLFFAIIVKGGRRHEGGA